MFGGARRRTRRAAGMNANVVEVDLTATTAGIHALRGALPGQAFLFRRTVGNPLPVLHSTDIAGAGDTCAHLQLIIIKITIPPHLFERRIAVDHWLVK